MKLFCLCLYRLSSTGACIFGILLENESVVLKLQKETEEESNLICDLVQILTEDDPDVVMNAAGAIASLVWLHDDIMHTVLYRNFILYLTFTEHFI